MSEMILFAHPTFGVLGILAAVWVIVETLNATSENAGRLKVAAYACAFCFVMAWIVGGYWYVTYYAPEKAVILKGPWPWAHDLFMETKEHLFFVPLILAIFLPIAAVQRLASSRGARAVVLATAALIIVNGLAVEGAGAIISHGVKVALMHPGQKGAE